MESEEFPMSPEIIAREHNKYTHLKEVIKKSDKFSDRRSLMIIRYIYHNHSERG
jgi:hypothetical protein